jgi:hypothetical protein
MVMVLPWLHNRKLSSITKPPILSCGCPARTPCKHYYGNVRAQLIRDVIEHTVGDPEGEEELKPSPLPTFIDPQTGRVMLPGSYGWKLLYRRYQRQ